MTADAVRCFGEGDDLYTRYHDEEWGRPVRGERALYERVCLEGFQAGLSWLVVLRRREALRQAFEGFDPEAVASFAGTEIERLLANPAIIRNRAKIEAAVTNARATIALRETGTPLDALIWSFRPAPPPAPRSMGNIPAFTTESVALSRALKQAGFRFVGPTTAYALMQACGLVNDHLDGCLVREDVATAQARVA
ncbi:MAG TPA: DNA-3-methyladenine glycosylase I [Chloroflexota bacterium]|nr:DNA-3-methyladenine glycosylase I [Chloroflexota bacterium]